METLLRRLDVNGFTERYQGNWRLFRAYPKSKIAGRTRHRVPLRRLIDNNHCCEDAPLQQRKSEGFQENTMLMGKDDRETDFPVGLSAGCYA